MHPKVVVTSARNCTQYNQKCKRKAQLLRHRKHNTSSVDKGDVAPSSSKFPSHVVKDFALASINATTMRFSFGPNRSTSDVQAPIQETSRIGELIERMKQHNLLVCMWLHFKDAILHKQLHSYDIILLPADESGNGIGAVVHNSLRPQLSWVSENGFLHLLINARRSIDVM